MNKPNILLIVSDDHGRESLGCYGNTVIRTPYLDGLASDGIRFTSSFCTTASCAASRSVILTGLYNHANGTYGHTHSFHHFTLFDTVETLPAYMNRAGYRTACIGKKHYAPLSLYPFDIDFGDSFGRNDIAMAETCREFLAGRSASANAENPSDKPFFLYWCSHNPHRSGKVAEDHAEKPNRFGNPDTPFEGDGETTYDDEEEVIVPPFLTDNDATRAELAQYYQSISRLDRGIGRLLSILKESGEYDRTLIIYVSDNGAAFPGSKTTLYEPGMRLPCIVKPPAATGEPAARSDPATNPDDSPRTCDALVTWADLTPTILDYADALGSSPGRTDVPGRVARADEFHGSSFRGVIEGRASEPDWREYAFASHTFHEITNYYPMRVVRSVRYKFIWNIAYPLTYSFASDLWRSATWQSVLNVPNGRLGSRTVEAYLHHDRFELYDLENDPDETENLAGQSEYADMVDDFAEKIREFQTHTGDPWIHKWEYE